MMSRKSIPEVTKLKLWVKSAGRCQFNGCNKPVWHNELTLSESNFAQIAHIIGSSTKGPRGNEQSEELQTNYDNLMLLCPVCHKEIDDFEIRYGVEMLREMKRKHEERIHLQTEAIGENNRSTILQFQSRIREYMPSIDYNVMYRAMPSNKFPTDTRGIKLSFPNFDMQGDLSEWTNAAKKIERKIKEVFEDGINEIPIKHLSVFAIGPMPLLMYLGKCIGDITPADIYESHRDIADTNLTWSWRISKNISPAIKTKILVENPLSKNIILALAISDDIQPDQYESLTDETSAVYKIYIDEPVTGFIKYPEQLEEFSSIYRKTINEIQSIHGKDCRINICPAVPISVAVESGRVLLTTKDSNIFACQYDKEKNVMIPVLQLT